MCDVHTRYYIAETRFEKTRFLERLNLVQANAQEQFSAVTPQSIIVETYVYMDSSQM